MRVGILTYDFDPPIGGLGIVVRQYLNLQKQSAKHTYIVMSPSPKADDRVSLFAALRWKKSGGCPLFSLAVNLVLQSLVRQHRLDVLHVHAGSGGVFLLRKPACPLVVTSHHTYAQEAKYVFTGAARAWKYFMSLLERRTYRLADRITCVSKDTADAIAEDYGIPREKIVVIENGVDESYFTADPMVVRDPATVLFIGRLEERKGILPLLTAFSVVTARVPGASLRLIGNNLLGSRIQQRIGELAIAPHTHLLGYVFESLRIREMRAASIVVIPSVLEGFGLVAAEAMALGCTVVVTDCPGLRSLVDDGRTGLIAPPGDAAALSEDIVTLLQDKALAAKLGQAAKEEALGRFRYDRGVRELDAVYAAVSHPKNN